MDRNYPAAGFGDPFSAGPGWSYERSPKVSKDLPEKQKGIEILLKDFVEFDQQLNQVILWVTPVKNQLELYNKVGQPGAFDSKECELSLLGPDPQASGLLQTTGEGARPRRFSSRRTGEKIQRLHKSLGMGCGESEGEVVRALLV